MSVVWARGRGEGDEDPGNGGTQQLSRFVQMLGDGSGDDDDDDVAVLEPCSVQVPPNSLQMHAHSTMSLAPTSGFSCDAAWKPCITRLHAHCGDADMRS